MTGPDERGERDGDADRNEEHRNEADRNHHGRNDAHVELISSWEWVVGAVGLIMVLAALALLLHEATQPSTPPDIAVRLDSVSTGRNVFVAHFTALNGGTAPATAVEIAGTLIDGGDTLEATATLDYLPGESRRSGGLLFPVDPRTRELRMRAVGYEAP